MGIIGGCLVSFGCVILAFAYGLQLGKERGHWRGYEKGYSHGMETAYENGFHGGYLTARFERNKRNVGGRRVDRA